jgi:hypothetical protein
MRLAAATTATATMATATMATSACDTHSKLAARVKKSILRAKGYGYERMASSKLGNGQKGYKYNPKQVKIQESVLNVYLV